MVSRASVEPADWETRFNEHQLGDAASGDVALPPDLFQKLTSGVAEKLNKAGESGHFPAIVTSVRRRRFLRTLLAAKGKALPYVFADAFRSGRRTAAFGDGFGY